MAFKKTAASFLHFRGRTAFISELFDTLMKGPTFRDLLRERGVWAWPGWQGLGKPQVALQREAAGRWAFQRKRKDVPGSQEGVQGLKRSKVWGQRKHGVISSRQRHCLPFWAVEWLAHF